MAGASQVEGEPKPVRYAPYLKPLTCWTLLAQIWTGSQKGLWSTKPKNYGNNV